MLTGRFPGFSTPLSSAEQAQVSAEAAHSGRILARAETLDQPPLPKPSVVENPNFQRWSRGAQLVEGDLGADVLDANQLLDRAFGEAYDLALFKQNTETGVFGPYVKETFPAEYERRRAKVVELFRRGGIDEAQVDAYLEGKYAEVVSKHEIYKLVERANYLAKELEDQRVNARVPFGIGREFMDQYQPLFARVSSLSKLEAEDARVDYEGVLSKYAELVTTEKRFTVIDLSRVWLEARVFEPDIPKVEGARSAWFTTEGYDAPFVVDERNGTLITVGRVVDPLNRTVPVIFEVANADGRLRIGQFAKVHIATGEPQRGLAVPDSAVLEDGGKLVAYVQVEGESFERRPLNRS